MKGTTDIPVHCPVCGDKVGIVKVTEEVELTVTYADGDGVPTGKVSYNVYEATSFDHDCKSLKPKGK